MKTFSAYIITGLVISASILLPCQQLKSQPVSIAFDHYTTNNGLSNNTIWEICKSQTGYLWLGTQDGLNRFDGKNFKIYRYAAKDSNSLSNNTVYKLLEDDNGYLWVGTFSGLNRYNPATNSFTRIRIGNHLERMGGNVGIGALGQSPTRKLIWVGTRGLFFVNPKTLSLAPAPGKLNRDLFDGGGNIFSLLVESDERIWIGSNRGLIIYNFKDSSYQLFNTNQKPLLPGKTDYHIHEMLLDNKGKLWIASWGLGLLEFDTAQKKFTGQYLPEENDGFKGGTNIIHSITQTNFPGEKNLVWLACNDSSYTAFNTETKKFTHYRTDRPDSRRGVYGRTFSLFFDKSDGLWIGGDKGLYRYDRRLQVYTSHPFRYNFQKGCLNYVFDAYPDPADETGNTLWIATWACGLFNYNLQTREFHDMAGWMKTQIKTGIAYHSILRDHQGLIWVGSTGEGLLAINEKQKTVSRFYPPDNKPGSVRTIRFLLEDDKGQLWAGTPYGLFVLDAERKKFQEIKYKVPDSIRKKLSTIINDLCSDQAGNIWFTAQNGYGEGLPVIGKINNGELTADVFYHQPADTFSFPDVKVVNNIICDQDNRLWCTSWNGLISWKAAAARPTFRVYTTDDGLIDNFIWEAEKDDKGNIWFGTHNGLSVFQRAKQKFRNFNNGALDKDDVDGIFFNEKQDLLMIADWGKLHTLKPGEVITEAEAPRVTISDFRVFDRPAPETGKYIFDSSLVTLAYNRNVVTIDFAALSFYNPSRVKYAYKMEGVDKNWIYTASNSVTYNLNNGRYTFYVKAMNAEGVWNEKGTFMEIVIQSPFWKKGWFISLIVLLVTGLLYSLYKYRINQFKKLQTMRNNISQNLHDDIGSSLSNINILNELAKRNAANPDKSKEYLDKSGEDIQRISESLSDIVWNINPRYDDLNNLFIRMKRYAADMMDGKNISYQLEFPEETERFALPMEKRRDMYLIFKEAVNNLVKYSQASEAGIKIIADKKKIIVEVKDNGKGFDIEKANTGNGIINMRQRAAACGAQLDIISEPGVGTEITLKINTT